MLSYFLAYLLWDPQREMFSFDIPLLGRPILWYGFFFALAFFLGYWILFTLIKHSPSLKSQAKQLTERIALYVIVGGLLGARLGDVLFYQHLADYIHHPLDIFKLWEGGLASHGGAIGILVALFLLSKKSSIKYLTLLDLVVIPTALAGCLIRMGNFFNQEILGTPSSVPWAVIFGHPIDASAPVPRHPVQLYESVFYLLVFFVLFLMRSSLQKKPGKVTGLFLILVFGFRFVIEFFKEEQSVFMPLSSLLDMGQILSIPFFILGLFLLFRRLSTN